MEKVTTHNFCPTKNAFIKKDNFLTSSINIGAYLQALSWEMSRLKNIQHLAPPTPIGSYGFFLQAFLHSPSDLFQEKLGELYLDSSIAHK